MLISCTSCLSKYLVNSADLKPNGRTVQCANCGNQWYQEGTANEEEEILASSIISNNSVNQSKEKTSSLSVANLPSTYVKEQKVSYINSLLVVLLVIALISGFWILKNIEINTLVLIKFYVGEFYFNLKLIINDIAKIIHQIIN